MKLWAIVIALILMPIILGAPTSNAGNDQSINLGNSVSLNGAGSTCSSCTINSYNWDFTDSNSASGVAVTHTFSSAGIYDVVLAVVANDGSVSSDTVRITVNNIDTTPPTITVQNITGASNNTAILISATITDNVGVNSATLYYKAVNATDFSNLAMTSSGSTYTQSIPASSVRNSANESASGPGGFDAYYYIYATDTASPANTRTTSTYHINVSATDTTAPITSLVSTAGKTSEPYWDNASDSKTTILLNGEAGMSCKYSTSDSATYSSLSNTCSVSGSQANCTINSLTEGNYSYYVYCKDASDNAQNSTNNLNVPSFGLDFKAPYLTGAAAVASSSGTIIVSWTLATDATSNVASIKLYRSTSNITSCSGSLLTSSQDIATSYVDSGSKTSGTVYYYKLCPVDNAGNTNSSVISVYATADSTAPSILADSTSVTATSATISVTTDEAATCKYSTSNTTYDLMSLSMTGSATSHTVTISSLSSSSSYDYYFICADTLSNKMSEATKISFTTSAEETTTTTVSSGGGGGGGGGAPAQQADSSKYWASIAANTEVSLKSDVVKTSVSEVKLVANKALSQAQISVTGLAVAPNTKTKISTKVYKYIELTRENIQESDLSQVEILFEIDNSWLTNNKINEDDVVLYRYVNNKWEELATRKISSTSTKVKYTAVSSGMSYFAIGEKVPEVTTTVLATTTVPSNTTPKGTSSQTLSTTLSTTTIDSAAATTRSGGSEEDSKKEGGSNLVLYIILLMAVLVGIGLVLYKKKQASKFS